MEEPEIAVVGTKGQIVIPKEMRRLLAIKPKTRLAVYRRGDKLLLTKLSLPTVGDELDGLFEEIDKQNRGKKVPGNREILQEIEARRKERTNQGV
jgi:AbrB family looped-hinge helix DNA binding protein